MIHFCGLVCQSDEVRQQRDLSALDAELQSTESAHRQNQAEISSLQQEIQAAQQEVQFLFPVSI